jgi:hypothetical protein
MKPTMALKPLAFALAALMAVAAHADQTDRHPQPQTAPTTLAVTTNDAQNNHGNTVLNDKTKNNASTSGSLNGSKGVANANIQSGDNNQAKNDVAIGSADDAAQVFATVNSVQSNSNNITGNFGNTNNASLNSSGNGASGVIQVNVSAGNSNQSSNSTAIASANGKSGAATVNAVQDVSSNLTLNVSTGHGWKTTPVTNNASVNSSLNGSSGVLGANVSVGTNNQAQNNVAITRF